MKIFKFGGGIIKDFNSIQKLSHIVKTQKPSIVVVSAIGKSTNHLEKIYQKASNHQTYTDLADQFFSKYHTILKDIPTHETDTTKFIALHTSILESSIKKYIDHPQKDTLYSAIVSIGEIMTSKIIFDYISQKIPTCVWLDARDIIKTTTGHTNAQIDWDTTKDKVHQIVLPILRDSKTILTQGFIAQNTHGDTTTLGREGSDYTAAIFAACLDAESVTLYKNVPGVMTASPQFFAQGICNRV